MLAHKTILVNILLNLIEYFLFWGLILLKWLKFVCQMHLFCFKIKTAWKKDDNKLKEVASITIDECFVVHDIKVIEGREGLFISMPSRKTPDGEYKDIVHPINTETREQIRDAILAAYEKADKEEE